MDRRHEPGARRPDERPEPGGLGRYFWVAQIGVVAVAGLSVTRGQLVSFAR
ncbi:MAG: hypothetical protein IPM29_05950 [Planctomycetes bacterium]|nr:hypothetical protein [Planctomycetota bacterium]